MEQYKYVLKALDELKIPYRLIEHPPAQSIEDADRYIEGIEGVRTKTLFLCNRKSTSYYLIVMDDSKRLDIKKFESLIQDKGIRFCSSERLMNKLGLEPGFVSIFGLLNNDEKDVHVILDKEILNEQYMSFHVNDNSKTAFITTEDMIRFVVENGFEYSILEL